MDILPNFPSINLSDMMLNYATELNQVSKISTPKSLVNYSATASARHIINYCLPVLHDYFMAEQLDIFYINLMSQNKARLGIQIYKPKFDVSKTTESLVAYIKFIKDYYWSDSILCPPHYKNIRSLTSKEIVKTLNSEELRKDFEVVSPLCKFFIQMLFFYDVGDFATDTVQVPQSACRSLSMLLQYLGPFHVSFLDTRSLEFALVSPYEVLFANTPDLKKIFVREISLGKKGMTLIALMCSKRLTEIGIKREGLCSRRSNLFEFFFKGGLESDITWGAYKDAQTGAEITFPNLKRIYICCAEGTEYFHGIEYAIRKFYTNLVISGIDKQHFHTFCKMPCCEDLNGTLMLSMTRNFILRHANPLLRRCCVKFLRYDSYCNIRILELSGSSSWFVQNRIEPYLTSSFGNFDALELFIHPDIELYYEPIGQPVAAQYLHRNFEHGLPRERQGFSLLLSNVGKTLLMLAVHVTMAIDMREGLHCLNLCPLLREFTLYFYIVHLADISPLLAVDINTLPELTKIVFHGELQMNAVRVNKLLRKIIKAAPDVRYLTLSGGLAKDIHFMSTDCFEGIETLHLKNVLVTKNYAIHLTGVLQRCPDVRELVLENVNDGEGWLKRVGKTTALSVRYVPECWFLEEL
ncbi:uncharacterized protein [Palaemon carinicauda]|uniref:uncharacterized protein n=1 Tax=Palaemon carinicauda TaxID=392227 RepID=UPI0035B65C60